MNSIIRFEEGYRETPYYCSEGYPTIGYGTKIGTKDAPLDQFCFTVNKNVANALLDMHLQTVREYLDKEFNLDEVEWEREEVLESMVYQLGVSGFSKFKNMIAATKTGDWSKAADEALDSRWASQTPERAHRHARVLREGNLDAYRGLL